MKHKHTPPADTLFALANLDLLHGYPLDDLVRITRDSDLINIPAGDVIDRAGTRARQFIGVVDGYIRGTTADGHEIVLGPGEQFGASELLAEQPHTMTYTSATPATIVATFGPAFRAGAVCLFGITEAARRETARRAEPTQRLLVAAGH